MSRSSRVEWRTSSRQPLLAHLPAVVAMTAVLLGFTHPVTAQTNNAPEVSERHQDIIRDPNAEIEEVIVSEKTNQDPTIMEEETKRLFTVAGAADDPLQAIFSLPGVTFSGDGEPVIRGSAPQDNAYYIDLIPALYLFHIFGNSIFNKNLIHKFELYPSAFPSQFGNATGGGYRCELAGTKKSTAYHHL